MESPAGAILDGRIRESSGAIKRPYRLVEILQETPNVKTFRFKSDFGEKLVFKPGQFVQIGYSSDGSKINVKRAYSIGSAPGSEVMEFYIEIVGGKFTSILDKSKVGDVYDISLPMGKNFEYEPGRSNKSLFLAAATGIAPFMSMLRYMEQNHIKEDVVVIYSAKTEADIIMKRELEEFERKGIARIVVTLTREDKNGVWNGETGRIDVDKIKRYVPDVKERITYLCGSNQFNSSMTDILKSLGVPADRDHIKHDVW